MQRRARKENPLFYIRNKDKMKELSVANCLKSSRIYNIIFIENACTYKIKSENLLFFHYFLCNEDKINLINRFAMLVKISILLKIARSPLSFSKRVLYRGLIKIYIICGWIQTSVQPYNIVTQPVLRWWIAYFTVSETAKVRRDTVSWEFVSKLCGIQSCGPSPLLPPFPVVSDHRADFFPISRRDSCIFRFLVQKPHGLASALCNMTSLK